MMRRLSVLVVGLLMAAMIGVCSADELKVGDQVPSTRVQGTDGKMHSLRDAVGHSWLVVAWYPKAATKGCTMECNNLRDNAAAIGGYHTVLFAASVDTPADNKLFAEHNNYPFVLLCDPSKKLATEMGVLGTRGVAQRWTFIVDEKAIIRYVNKSVNPETATVDLQAALDELHVPKK